jgi:hypothetical protein
MAKDRKSPDLVRAEGERFRAVGAMCFGMSPLALIIFSGLGLIFFPVQAGWIIGAIALFILAMAVRVSGAANLFNKHPLYLPQEQPTLPADVEAKGEIDK